MNTSQVLKMSPKDIEKIHQYYKKDLQIKTPPYSLFTVKNKNITITAYQSGKVLFQGPKAEEIAQYWSNNTQAIQNSSKSANSNNKAKTNNPSLPKDFNNWSVIGSDEVGNGSYFGPLVVCAAYVSTDSLAILTKLGVKDSKMLTDAQIIRIAEKLKTLIPFQLLNVSPKKYNQIQPKYNATHMKAVLHNQAIALLLEKIAPEIPDGILIDQFVAEKSYRRYVKEEKKQVSQKIYFITKGEQYHLAVAAASILARACFLEELAKSSIELGFNVPSGAGHQSDEVAARILNIGGVDLLANYAKLHFANTKKAQNLNY